MKWVNQALDIIASNGTYKLVALFITLSLWIFIFERQEATLTKSIKLNFLLAANHSLAGNSTKEIQFKVRGPRMGLKKFYDSRDFINVDLSNAGPGHTSVRIYDDILQLPAGVSVVSVHPSNISVDIRRASDGTMDKESAKESVEAKPTGELVPGEAPEGSSNGPSTNPDQNL